MIESDELLVFDGYAHAQKAATKSPRIKPPKRPWGPPKPVAPKDKPVKTSCLAEHTLVQTPDGIRALDELFAGDHLVAQDGGAVAIRWIGRARLRPGTFPKTSNCADFVLPKGCFGDGIPLMDLRVPGNQWVLTSDQQRVQVCQLSQRNTVIHCAAENEQRPFHIHLARDEFVFANGLWVNLLGRCPDPRISFSRRQRSEITQLYPGFVG